MPPIDRMSGLPTGVHSPGFGNDNHQIHYWVLHLDIGIEVVHSARKGLLESSVCGNGLGVGTEPITEQKRKTFIW